MPCSLSATEIKARKQRLQPFIKQIKNGIIENEIAKANRKIYYDFKVKQAIEIVKLANKIFPNKLAVAFSGGKDSLVALHLALKVNSQISVIFNNTTVEFPETVKYVKKLQEEWSLNLNITINEVPFLRAVQKRGWASHDNRWCCLPYKDHPAFKFLAANNVDAEITGTTRTESIYRRSLTPFRLPKKEPYIIRINPIYDWNEWEVWTYIKEDKLPYNPLYDMGYRRIGCWCCPLNGPTHYKRLQKTHPKLYSFLMKFRPAHPTILKLNT